MPAPLKPNVTPGAQDPDVTSEEKDLNYSEFPLTIVFIKDPKDKGYTSFFKEYSNAVAEGKTKYEAAQHLIGLLYDIMGYEITHEGDFLKLKEK